ncbi:uncharacterized protein [Panulirus ornatus]|uniref:uncharacterized protein isoform X2 n=1 Tax=Panulirus ornatus TaxID=150431 RepID=UPI003A898AA6
MNYPLMRRGLSPEGRKIRDRHQGSLTIGIQGITVHPAERGRTQNNFLQENVRRLHEIQSRCKERDNSKRSQPLKATRLSSGSTTSSLRERDASGVVRNGSGKLKRSQSVEREGSAHSDYFSLTEEQIEPVGPYPSQHLVSQSDGSVTSNDCVISKNEWNTENTHSHSRSPVHHHHKLQTNCNISSLDSQQRSRPGSPVVLKPITTRDTQTTPTPMVPALRQIPGGNQMILSDYELTQEMRKMRMGNIMSKIKTQKPSCELDYNSLYKSIENQHKLLLENSDRLSSCGSGDGSARNETSTQRSGIKSRSHAVTGRPGSLKMLRAHSFDRDILNKRNGNVVARSEKLNNTNGKNFIKKNSVHPLSPQLKKRFSKSNNNLVHNNPSLLHESGSQEQSLGISNRDRKCINNDGICGSGQSPKKHDQPKVQAMQRSKSNLERPRVKTNRESKIESTSHLYDQTTASGLYPESKTYADETTNANVPMDRTTSSVDLNLGATVSCNDDIIIDDQNNSVLDDSRSEELHLNIRPESQSNGSVADQTEDDRVFQDELDFNNIDTPCNEAETIQDENDPETNDMRTSTPVSSNSHDVPLGNPAPKPLKETHQAKVSTSALKSQSLKNMQQHPGNLPSTYKKGKIPKYILARKEEDRRKAELALAADPDCPPGHTPLPDHERRNTLHLLRKSQAEVMRELSSLPVAQDTLRLKKVRQGLEEKLTQIEDGLRIFSQPKVYVMNDE